MDIFSSIFFVLVGVLSEIIVVCNTNHSTIINIIIYIIFPKTGHILFIIIEKIKGSPVNPETENKIHTIGLFLLMLLMVVITFNDILRLF